MKALLIALVLAAAVLIGVNLLASGPSDEPGAVATTGGGPVLRPVAAPRLSERQIDRQDPPDARRQRDEARAFDRRPLLNALPITLHGVRFLIGGLAADARTTIIVADAGGLGRRRAVSAWEALLRRTGDRSGAYRLKVKP